VVLADRYRIVGPVGKGGMGEVYRADDLKLGLAVALKFLPEDVQDDPDRLERLFNEVRLAREISHPAVCRVHDVGEVDGQHFITMEYVDGEDLAALLRRIGRLPGDKAVEIARQLCAGLAAAHDKGVLHRDFKPQNVMLDGLGKARITDFGLATLATRGIDDVRSGTPAYMAPEQLEGREVTVRSDVYALGLVLYELFTGRRAVEGRTLDEITRRHREEPPPTPSSVVPDIDAVVERAILHCLEKNPNGRPASALAVAAMLPGGDPLAAALAAGETPSPEMVAASGRTEGLSTRAVWVCLATVAAGLAATLVLTRDTQIIRMVPLPKPPAVLDERARDIVKALGYEARPVRDALSGFSTERMFFTRQKDLSPTRWDGLRKGRPEVMTYWYRQAASHLVAWDRRKSPDWNDPPFMDPDMIGVRLDTLGRLVQFYAIVSRVEPETPAATPVPAPDWNRVLTEAGLDTSRLQPVAPRRFGMSLSDARMAWEGTYAEAPETKIRVEAAAYKGRLTNLQIVLPWHVADPANRPALFWTRGTALVVVMALAVLFIGGPALLARRHMLAGRGDRAGAGRLATYVFSTSMLAWALGSHHVANPVELDLMIMAIAAALLNAGYVWLVYLALEPYVRRTAPFAIISWTRILSGRHRDPLVGRDVLVGTAWGTGMAALGLAAMRTPAWLGRAATEPRRELLNALLGWREIAEMVLGILVGSALLGMVLMLIWAIAHGRGRTRQAMLLTFLVASFATVPMIARESPDITVAAGALLGLATTWLLVRFGLLATIAGIVVKTLFLMPLTSDLSAWTSGPTTAVIVVVVLLAAWSTRTTLAGRPLLAID
jgi:serine/threonine-protein kinase